MSIRHVAVVLDHYPHGDARKLVLIAIAEQANEATWVCWPSLERIAKRSCISTRHAKRIVNALEDEGVLDVVRGRGRKTPNKYRVRYDVLSTMAPLVDKSRPEINPLDGFAPIGNVSVDNRPEPVDNPVGNVCKERGHDVPFVSEKVTPRPGKGDVAVSPKPEVTLKRPSPPTAPEDSRSGEEAVFGSMVENLADRWTGTER